MHNTAGTRLKKRRGRGRRDEGENGDLSALVYEKLLQTKYLRKEKSGWGGYPHEQLKSSERKRIPLISNNECTRGEAAYHLI